MTLFGEHAGVPTFKTRHNSLPGCALLGASCKKCLFLAPFRAFYFWQLCVFLPGTLPPLLGGSTPPINGSVFGLRSDGMTSILVQDSNLDCPPLVLQAAALRTYGARLSTAAVLAFERAASDSPWARHCIDTEHHVDFPPNQRSPISAEQSRVQLLENVRE